MVLIVTDSRRMAVQLLLTFRFLATFRAIIVDRFRCPCPYMASRTTDQRTRANWKASKAIGRDYYKYHKFYNPDRHLVSLMFYCMLPKRGVGDWAGTGLAVGLFVGVAVGVGEGVGIGVGVQVG